MRSIFFLLYILAFNVGYTQITEVLIDTQISGPVTVCGSEIIFTTTIKNQSAAVLQNVKLYPGFPSGMIYVSASGITQVNSPNQSEGLSFSLADFAVGEQRPVVFYARAECSLLVGLAASKLAKNDTKLTYGVDQVSAEPNGSESYSVLSAQLELFVPEAEKNIAADFINVIKSRHITIKNSGLGSIPSLDFYIKTETELELQKLEVMKAGGNLLVTSVGTTDLGRKYTINDFSSIGDGDNAFEEGESIVLMDYVKVLAGKASIATSYTTQWGCSNVICNTSDQQSSFDVYITAIGGKATVVQTSEVSKLTDFCNLPAAEIKFTSTNNGTGNLPESRDAAFNLNWVYIMTHFSLQGSYQFYLQRQDQSLYDITADMVYSSTTINGVAGYYDMRYTINLDNRFAQDIDGAGGLADIDQDGFFDDLPTNSSLRILVKVKPLFTGDLPAFNSTLYSSYSAFLSFTTWGGSIGSQTNNGGQNLYTLFNFEKTLSGPSDLESSGTKIVTLTTQIGEFTDLITNTNNVYEFNVTLPDGVYLVNAKYLTSNPVRNLVFTQTGNHVKIVDPLTKYASFTIEFELGLNCSASNGLTKGNMAVDVFQYSDINCPDSRFKIVQLEKEVFLHCSTCPDLETTQFVVNRTTMGWQPTSNLFYPYNDLFGPAPMVSKVNPSTPGIKLDAAYPRDEVEISLKGRVNNGAYTSLSAAFNYRSQFNVEVFHYSSGVLLIDGVEYPLSAGILPAISNTSNLFGNTFTIPLGQSGMPATISSGKNFELRLKYIVDDLISAQKGEYPILDFRGGFFTIVAGNRIQCQDFGDNFLIYRPTIDVISNDWGSSYELSSDGKAMIGHFFCGQGNNSNATGIFDFPNEFRPLYFPSSLTSTLPKGFIFDTSQPIRFITYYSNVYFTLAGIVYSADKRTVSIAKESLPAASSNVMIFASIKIDCENPDNIFVPSVVAYDQRIHYTKYSLGTFAYVPLNRQGTVVDRNLQLALFNTRRSNLQLTANSKQEGYSDIVKWPVQICNPYSPSYSNSFNTWISIEPKADDSSTVLQGVTDENNNPLPVLFYGPKDGDHPSGRNMMVKLGTMNLSACLQLNVIAKYKNCEENKEQDIDIYASGDYYAYPDLTNYQGSVKDKKGCEGFLVTQTMSIKYKTAALQWEVRKNGPDATDLCVPVNFEIDLTSTKYADMNQLKVWLDLPHNITIDAANAPSYNYPYTGAGVVIPATAALNENGRLGWDIAKILGGNLPGIRLANNKIKLSFNLVSSCGFDPGLPVKYTVDGFTNCGEFVQFIDQRKIKIQGFTLDELELHLTAMQPPECDHENDFNLTFKNNGTASSTINQLEITLPSGVEYRSILQTDLPEPVVTEVNGQTKLNWTLAAQYLTAGQQKSLVLRTFLTSNSETSGFTMTARTFQTSDALCAESNTSCATQATTGSSDYTIVVGLQSALDFRVNKYLCAYQFKPLINASLGCDVLDYTWDFGDNTSSKETQPFHAYSASGTYNVSLNIIFACGGCSGTQSKQMQVVVSPTEDEFDELVISVSVDKKLKVLQTSASTFSDAWPLSHVDEELNNLNSYLNGAQGVWRNDATYVYKTDRSQDPAINISQDGVFDLLNFNWQLAELDAVPKWIKASSMTQYSPNSYELENKDVLGIYSAALYDYGGHLPSANGSNMRNDEMGFTSFESRNQDNLSGNLIWGNKPVPNYTRYNVYYGIGNMAVIEASMDELENVEMVDVSGRKLFGFLNSRFNYVANDKIICKQPWIENENWTVIVLQISPAVNNIPWQGTIRVTNTVLPVSVATLAEAKAHSGKQSLQITSDQVFVQPLLHLDSGKTYFISAWVAVTDPNVWIPGLSPPPGIEVVIRDKPKTSSTTVLLSPAGPIIEGWQQVKGRVGIPDVNTTMELKFKSGSAGTAWFDDLRIHPEKGNMKSYVYSLVDYRLQSILDEENFASFYYYDKEGNLTLVKKETSEGVKTISENSSYTIKHEK